VLLLIYLTILMLVSAVLVFKVQAGASSVCQPAGFLWRTLGRQRGGIATTKAYAQEKAEFSRFYAMTRVCNAKIFGLSIG